MKNIICYLFGHKNIDSSGMDLDYCKRCKMHQYFEPTYYEYGILLKAYIKIRQIPINLKTWYRYKFYNELPF